MKDKKHKYIEAIDAKSLRELIEEVNAIGLTKEDIVSFNKIDSRYIMIYYR